MKKNIFIVPILLLATSACQKESFTKEPEPTSKAELAFATESSDSIADLNIYAFNITTGKNIAHCFTMGSRTLELPYGKYEVFALANTGKDLGAGMTLEQLKKQRYNLPSDAIPMCGSNTVELIGGTTTLPITLVRCPAKVEIKLEVAEGLKSMVIQSIQLKDAAMGGLFFPTEEPADETGDLPLEYTSDTEKRALKRTYIIGENCRGTIPTISSQREKNPDNAPERATYLLINALSGNSFCTFRVFLGENNTTDFNIRRNSVHQLSISIRGEDEIDTRMESDPIEIEDDMEHSEFPGACIPGDYHLTFSPLRDNDETYSAEIEILSGNSDSFMVDGEVAPKTIELGNMSSQKTIPVSYTPSAIDSESSTLKYTVTIRSGKGNVYTKEFNRIFCNQLFVYVSYPAKGYPEGGDVEPDGRFIKRVSTENYRAVRILVPKSKEYLQAICSDGFALDGWYRGLQGQIITQNEKYSHKCLTLSDTLAMKFKREKCFIYTDIENVEVLCFKKEPIVIAEKSAYAVDPGMYCSIRGKDLSRPIAGWYDDPVLRTSDHLVSTSPEYEFTATENIKLYPQYR